MSILKVNDIEPAVAGGEKFFLSRSWVNCNGTGTVAIRASGNISSLVDQGVGFYTFVFSNNAPSTNYSMLQCQYLDSRIYKGNI